MDYYIGIDLGTSSVKCILIGEGKIIKSVSRDYPLYTPKPSYSEQSPMDWYNNTIDALSELLVDAEKDCIRSVSFSGQMHGLVLLDKNGEVIRPAILWNDGRSVKEVEYLNNEIGKDCLLEHTGNIAFAGFTAPKLLWVKDNEPENFRKISKILLPKDYLAYKLSGVFATDVSDASGTLYFDTKNRCWSDKILGILGIDTSKLPDVYESGCVIGTIKPELADILGLKHGVSVVIGGGDNACAAIGTGTLTNGNCNISLGTSGTVFVVNDSFSCVGNGAIHSFCSANGKFHYLACILSAASAQKWWIESILKAPYSEASNLTEKDIIENPVIFMPYLTGERSPINSPYANSAFIGMTPETTRSQMTSAVLEGVAFALLHNIDIIRDEGLIISRSKICGGGAKNKTWLKIIASALDITLEVSPDEQGAALGAALLAAKGIMNDVEWKYYSESYFKTGTVISPDPLLKQALNDKYRKYRLMPVIR